LTTGRAAVVFDFAGVLFHWHPPTMLQRVLPHRAPDADAALRLCEALFEGWGGDWDAFDRGTVEAAPLVARIAARTGLPAPEVRAVIDEVPRELQPVPAMVELVHELHAARRPLRFLSNMPAPYADHLERTHAFLRCFSDGVFSARVQCVKPERGIYELAAQRFGTPPGELLFFDDVAGNVAAALEAGWKARHFVDVAGCRRELCAAGLLPR
jgi:putative hydrolase of the HAD superfamily